MNKQISSVKSLFKGKIEKNNIFPFPKIEQSEAETLRIVLESITKFMSSKEEEFNKYDHEGKQPEEYIQALKELGLFGLIIPEEYGGLGLSNSAYARVIEETSRFDASTSLTVGAHSSIGMKGLLLFGNKKQKEKYLPKLATGEMIAAFCLTEAGAGSDAASIKTNAVKQKNGSWSLTGEKIWITNGDFAEFFTVFAKTKNENKETKDKKPELITAFIVERSFKGLSTGPKEDKMGIRASATTTVNLDNVVVPAENVLGEAGEGFKIAMAILNNGRTGLGGGSVGGMKRMINLATAQASERKQFGSPISEFGLVQEKISQMTVDCFATESVVSIVGHFIDSDFDDYSLEAAISKVFASEALWQTSNSALQIAGGNGFMKEYPYEKYVRDSRINLIFEGTNEILRLYIALTGMKGLGDDLKKFSSSIKEKDSSISKKLNLIKEYALKKLSQLTPLGREKIDGIHSSLQKEVDILNSKTQKLSLASEKLLIKHKKNIISRQFELKRIANITIDIFVGLCLLARVNEIVKEKSNVDEEIRIAKIFVSQASQRIEIELAGLKSNSDKEIETLAKHITKEEGYLWDSV